MLKKFSRNPVGILLDSWSQVGIGGGAISTEKKCQEHLEGPAQPELMNDEMKGTKTGKKGKGGKEAKVKRLKKPRYAPHQHRFPAIDDHQ